MFRRDGPVTDQIDSIRKRLESIEKELFAIKQGAWAGVVRYQQIMDDEPSASDNAESEYFSDSGESST